MQLTQITAIATLTAGFACAAQATDYTLSPLGGLEPNASFQGINTRGRVVGTHTPRVEGSKHLAARAFVYDIGAVTELAMPPAGTRSFAAGISDDDIVVGHYIAKGRTHGAIWVHGVGARFDVPGAAATVLMGISADSHYAVGCWYGATVKEQRGHAFALDRSSGQLIALRASRTSDGCASGVNNAGRAVGNEVDSTAEGVSYAGYTVDIATGASRVLLASTSSIPRLTGINDRGLIAAMIPAPTAGKFYGAVLDADGALVAQFEDWDFQQTWPGGINQAGIVVGHGHNPFAGPNDQPWVAWPSKFE